MRLASLFASLVLTYSAALIGTLFTVDAVDTWYAALAKPALNPPDWVFGPVWTVLYALMAVAAWGIYEKRREAPQTRLLLWMYAAHLAVNAFWSIAFFGLHNPALALGVIIVLWAMVMYLAANFYRTDRLAGLLFVPYALWISFASYLNLSIVLLN